MIFKGWYVPTVPHGFSFDLPPPRWVLGVMGDKVCYSKGGDRHYFCRVRTMKRWLASVRAKRALSKAERDHFKSNDLR